MSSDFARLIDAARLREAIAKAKDFALRQYSMRPEEVAPLLEAAEAYIGTPVTYEVSGISGRWGEARRRFDEVSTRDAAAALAALLVEEGCHTIFVTEFRS